MEEESSVKNPSPLSLEDGIARQSAGYAPSLWGDYFIKHRAPLSSITPNTEDWMRERVGELVREVSNLLIKDTNHELQCLELIDALQRLGIGYHFEEEIDKRLREFHDNDKIDGNDLHFVALKFRLLRQHGYHLTSDLFSKFKDDEGMFKCNLANDVRGLLSLYEACFLATNEDDILDKALSFTKHNLQSDVDQLDSALKALVSHALELPLHRRIPRLEARFYITAYELDKQHRIDIVLELAKLDFNLLQSLHYEEARNLSIWWEGIGLAEKFGFSRDRIVECYFWILSVYSEPKYSLARKITTKSIALMSINDDIYDVYGTSDELQTFTDVIVRWDLETAEQLNGYLKIQFQNMNNAFQNFEDELRSCGKSYSVHYLKEIFKVVCTAWNEEVKWRDAGYIPTLKEHLQVTTVSTCYNFVCCASFMGMGDAVTKKVFDWVLTFPKFTHHASVISRLRDDVTSQEREQQRNHVASAVQCYMKEHNSTLEKACEELLKMVQNEWKCLNHEYLCLSGTFSRVVLMRVINFARFMETFYDGHDMYTNSALAKTNISLLLVEPVSF